MAKSQNSVNVHRVQGLAPKRRTEEIDFEETVNLKNELYRKLKISAFPLEEESYMNLEGLIREEMNIYPLPERISSRLVQIMDFGVVPLSYNNNGKDYGLMVGIKNEESTIGNIFNIGMGFSDFASTFFSIDKDRIKYILLSPVDYEKASKLVTSADARKQYLNNIDEESAAEEIYFALIKTAIVKGATDIHVEPLRDRSRVRMRIDGVLQEYGHKIASERLPNLMGIIKERGRVPDILAKAIPQDGSTMFDSEFFDEYGHHEDGKPESYIEKFPEIRKQLAGYSLRVATMPTNHGEKAAIRLLNSNTESFDLKELGFPDETRKKIENLTDMPQGLILVSGPTGSGKTTTLYSAIHALNKPELNIVTIENPIEKDLSGVNQSGINPKRGWDFDNCLEAYLRQDPDVILVGEVRNAQTAQVALEASSTGHLVLSTIHTNDSISAIIRLLHLGIEPALIQDNLTAVIAQRLYRKLCPKCKDPYDAKDQINELLREEIVKDKLTLYREKERKEGNKCSFCEGLGYKGRNAVAELWVLGDEEREMILEGCRLKPRYYEVAVKGGLVPLVCSGLDLVLNGVTSIPEILERVSSRGEFLAKKNLLREQIKGYLEKKS
ncbi:Type II/IV secretion system protein [uncultured archaeon]|nr:Type II/IV secretion system protein [uncultured archaeon]